MRASVKAAVAAAVVGVLATLHRWLPKIVIALRVWIFAKVNGSSEVTLPGQLIGADRFEQVYSHPAANGRSKGAALSDLFWYWLAPGAEVHQEHLEAGHRYEEVARTTRSILSLPTTSIEEMAARSVNRILDELPAGRWNPVRLRDLMMPVWAEYFYELVFQQPCPRHARDLIVANADDVVTALKCTGLRHMGRRKRLTRYLLGRIDAGEVPHELPHSLTREQQAYYLQGTYFNTAVVQMSEAMAHLLLVIAEHEDVQRELVSPTTGKSRYLEHLMAETFRLFPLFGVAHRITTDTIEVAANTVIPRGTVLVFDYQAYESTGYENADRFDPARWETLSAKDAHHIPFGVAANRSCPAWRLSPIAMQVVTRQVLRRYRLHSSVSHNRSIPHRAPCLLVSTDSPPSAVAISAALLGMRVRDRWEDVWRSVVQLVLGTWMVLDARRVKPCTTYFAEHDLQGARLAESTAAGRCPVQHF